MSISVTSRGFLSRTDTGGGSGLSISFVDVADLATLNVVWNTGILLTEFGAHPTAWSVVDLTTNEQMVVTAVLQDYPDVITLTVVGLSNNSTYRLSALQDAVAVDSQPNDPVSADFSTPLTPLTVESVRLVDATGLIVVFSRAVLQDTATVPGNYVFNPPLNVKVVERISANQYLLRTARMQPNTSYVVTVDNVRALDGSLIDETVPPV